MLLLGSSVKVAPIVAWDGQPIGDGKPGPVSKALLALLEEDMRTGDRLIPVRIRPGLHVFPSGSYHRNRRVILTMNERFSSPG